MSDNHWKILRDYLAAINDAIEAVQPDEVLAGRELALEAGVYTEEASFDVLLTADNSTIDAKVQAHYLSKLSDLPKKRAASSIEWLELTWLILNRERAEVERLEASIQRRQRLLAAAGGNHTLGGHPDRGGLHVS